MGREETLRFRLKTSDNPRLARVYMEVTKWSRRPLTPWFGSISAGAKELARLMREQVINGEEARRLLLTIRETFPRLILVRTTSFVVHGDWAFHHGAAYGGWFFQGGECVSPLITDAEDAVAFLARVVHAGSCPPELVGYLLDQVDQALQNAAPTPAAYLT